MSELIGLLGVGIVCCILSWLNALLSFTYYGQYLYSKLEYVGYRDTCLNLFTLYLVLPFIMWGVVTGWVLL